jgi:CHC2 zinc finger
MADDLKQTGKPDDARINVEIPAVETPPARSGTDSTIPESIKRDVLARVDLVSVISPHVQLKKAGNRFYGLCPFHKEKTASFAVHTERQFYYCFGCQVSGDAIGFMMRYHGLTFLEAVKQLADQVGMELPKGAPVSRRVIQRRIDAEAMLETMEQELSHWCVRGEIKVVWTPPALEAEVRRYSRHAYCISVSIL